MPRADAERLAGWDGMRLGAAAVLRQLEERLAAERQQDLGVYFALEALVRAGGRLRASELADALALRRPTTSRLCDRLACDGLVTRERPGQDGRAVEIVLTRSGREEYRRCQPAYERFVNDAFGARISDSDIVVLLRVARGLGVA